MKNKRLILIITLTIVVLTFAVFKNIQLGYSKVNIITDKGNEIHTIALGVPKLSFMKKENEKSYSYKNIRGNKVLVQEVKSYLNTLNKLECNGTTYYYDNKNDFTVINYSVSNHILYNTIAYEVRYGDYCFNRKVNEYTNILGGVKRLHTLNGKFSLSEDKEFAPLLQVTFLDDINLEKQEFTATLMIRYLTPRPNVWNSAYRKEIEKSMGTYEIKDSKLYYTRTNIELKADDIDIPQTSVFEIKDQQLILVDNYLSKYDNNVVLK